MKKAALLFSLALLGAAAPSAGLAQGISFGVKAGVNMATVGGDAFEDVDLSSRFGAAAGVFLNFAVSEAFSIQPEALFSQKGTSFADVEDIDLTMDYVEVPVLFRYAFPLQGSPVRPVIFAGPAASLLLSAEFSDEDIKDELKSLDFGGVLGAGIEVGQLSIDARYGLGFGSIDDTVDDVDVKNRAFTFTIGYAFPLGR